MKIFYGNFGNDKSFHSFAPYLEKVKDRILIEVDKLFSKYGIKSITMDDIARELGISKKTIYHNFENKDDLVYQWTQNSLESMRYSFLNSSTEAKNAIEESLLNEQAFLAMFRKISPSIYNDLKKYFPECRVLVEDFKIQAAKLHIEKMIQRGLNEKIFREDLNIPMVAKIHFLTMDACFETGEFSPSESQLTSTFLEIQNMFLGGLCNLEGLKLLFQYRNHSRVYPSISTS